MQSQLPVSRRPPPGGHSSITLQHTSAGPELERRTPIQRRSETPIPEAIARPMTPIVPRGGVHRSTVVFGDDISHLPVEAEKAKEAGVTETKVKRSASVPHQSTRIPAAVYRQSSLKGIFGSHEDEAKTPATPVKSVAILPGLADTSSSQFRPGKRLFLNHPQVVSKVPITSAKGPINTPTTSTDTIEAKESNPDPVPSAIDNSPPESVISTTSTTTTQLSTSSKTEDPKQKRVERSNLPGNGPIPMHRPGKRINVNRNSSSISLGDISNDSVQPFQSRFSGDANRSSIVLGGPGGVEVAASPMKPFVKEVTPAAGVSSGRHRIY